MPDANPEAVKKLASYLADTYVFRHDRFAFAEDVAHHVAEFGWSPAGADRTHWPAFAYLYGTWDYALARARELATEKQQKTYLYGATMNGRSWWVVSWDPKDRGAADPDDAFLRGFVCATRVSWMLANLEAQGLL